MPEGRKKLEDKARKFSGKKIGFVLKRQEIDRSLSEHLQKDIKDERASIVVLFNKQKRNWVDKLFARNEAREMSFNSDVPLLIFRKKE